MINWLIDASLRNRFLVVVVCLLLGVWGYWALLTTPIDAIPDLSDNQVIVFTDWPGRSPQEVEDQVTYPLTVSLQGLPGVRVVRASSAFGFSIPPTPPKERNVPLAPSAESRPTYRSSSVKGRPAARSRV
jgi:copper/silver efflux system protein